MRQPRTSVCHAGQMIDQGIGTMYIVSMDSRSISWTISRRFAGSSSTAWAMERSSSFCALSGSAWKRPVTVDAEVDGLPYANVVERLAVQVELKSLAPQVQDGLQVNVI